MTGLCQEVNEYLTYPAHEPSAIFPIDGAFARMSYAANIALSPQEDGVHERLWLVQALGKKYGYADETEERRQIVGDKVVGE